jgi:hypothetical protein
MSTAEEFNHAAEPKKEEPKKEVQKREPQQLNLGHAQLARVLKEEAEMKHFEMDKSFVEGRVTHKYK